MFTERDVKVTCLPAERTVRAAIFCELDHHTARPIREKIDASLLAEKPDLLILDFSDVKFMDSSGIGLILGRLSLCEEIGASVEVTGLSGTLARVVRLSGIGKMPRLRIAATNEKGEQSR